MDLSERFVPDHLDHGLQIVFVGFNPSLRSAETGHHYANPRNRFWRILFRSGLTPRLYDPSEDAELLKLGYGFTNIVARPTKGIDDIRSAEYQSGRKVLADKLLKWRPRIVCFVGKGVYTQFSRHQQADWGFQEEPVIKGIHEFVAPSSSGLVRMPLEEIIGIYARLADVVRQETSGEF